MSEVQKDRKDMFSRLHLCLLRILGFILCSCQVANSRWLHVITISKEGNDTTKCLKNESIPCLTLDYVLKAVVNKNSTVLFVEPGYYHLNSSFSVWHVKQFGIIGLSSNSRDVMVNCSPLAGLSFIYSEEIILENITLSSCGALQNSTSRRHPQFLTGLFLVNCINLTMDRVKIIDGPGIGMQLYDVSGTVRMSNCHFLRNGNRTIANVTNIIPGYVPSGGGIYIEYTYKGGLWPFSATPNHIYQENSSFYLFNLSFEENVAPEPNVNDSVIVPNASDHVAFGRGGGLSMFCKGNARNNKFWFDSCHFNQNSALWGGGFFVEFHDETQNNVIMFNSSVFYENKAEKGGGGMRVGLITMLEMSQIIPNAVNFKSCHYEKNKAVFGGAVSLYGTTKPSYLTFPDRSFINFTSCEFEKNYATVGSALGSALWNMNNYGVGGGDPIKLYFINCNITKNMIIFTEDDKVSGTGALFSDGVPTLFYDIKFTLNNGSALVLVDAVAHIGGMVSFRNNSGRKGGAMALYGANAKLKVAKQSHLHFIGNTCSEKGGAIYVRTVGPLLVAFQTTELNLDSCFISSDQDGFYPDKWDFDVSFFGNKSPNDASGHSVFATTLQFCREPDEGRIKNQALQWKTFHYYPANQNKSDIVHEIATNPVEMRVNKADWNVTDDKTFSPTVKLIDEKNNSVYGIISIRFQPENQLVLNPPSAYYLAKDRIQSLIIQGKPHTHYNVILSTVSSQLIVQEIDDAYIGECSPGFVSRNKTCKCDLDNIGLSRCEDKNQILFLLKGYWGGYVRSNHQRKFITVPCPENYCFCNTTVNTVHPASDGECFFDRNNQCSGNRHGRLCGKCKANFSLKVGEDGCVNDCKSGYSWIGYVIGLVLFLTLMVLVIMFVNFDPFSAYLNAWLYSYQVILFLLPEGITLDPFLLFIVGLANVRIIGFGGVCMWSGMDDLQKLAFNYLLPLYVFICLFLLNKIALTCRDNYLTRRLTQTSTARACCTLLVLSYSTVTYVSLIILYPVKIGEKYFVFHQGTETYFGSYHAGFGITAVILLAFVGVLFPLVLIRRQWFKLIDKGLTKLLLDNFQNCFRDGYKWCAGFYFVCRFLVILILTVAPPGALRVSLLQSACTIVLTGFVLCRPYADSDGPISYHVLNTSDAVLLCNLCILSSFNGALSGIFRTDLYYNAFKIVIRTLGYVPLLYSVGLFGYFLASKYVSRFSFLRDVGSYSEIS